jgi:hypothetical protein
MGNFTGRHTYVSLLPTIKFAIKTFLYSTHCFYVVDSDMYLSNAQRIVAFPLQHCLCEGAAVLRSAYMACLVKNEYIIRNIPC